MAADDEVLIKIAADVSAAVASMQSLVQSIGQVAISIQEIGKSSQVTSQLVQASLTAMQQVGQASINTSQAVIGLTQQIASMSTQITAMAQAHSQAQPQTQSFWDALLNGTQQSQVAAFAWGKVMGEALSSVQDGIKNAITGFPKMISAFADMGDQTKTMAARLGTTTTAISELQYVGRQAGVSTEIMARTMQTLNTQLSDTGSKATKAVQSIGLIPKAIQEADTAQGLTMVMEALKQIPDQAERSAKFFEIFGSRARGMTQLMTEDMKGLITNFEELGGTKNQQRLGELGDQFNDLSNDIKVVGDAFKRELAVAVLPWVNEILAKIPKLGGAMVTAGSAAMDFGNSLLPIVANSVVIAGDKGLMGIWESLKKVGPGIQHMGIAFAEGTEKMGKFLATGGTFKQMFTDLGPKVAEAGSKVLSFGTNLGGLIPFIGRVTTALYSMTAAALTNPYVALGVAIVALGVALYKLVGGWEAISAAVSGVVTFFEDLYTIVTALIDMALTDMLAWATAFYEEFMYVVGAIGEFTAEGQALTPVLQGIVEFFQLLGKTISIVYTNLGQLASAIGGFFKWIGKEVHEAAEGQRAYNAALAHAKKLADDLNKTREAKPPEQPKEDPVAKRLAEVKKLQDAVKGLTKAEEEQIKTLLKVDNAKDVGETLAAGFWKGKLSAEEAAKAVKLFEDNLKAADREAKKDPFAKLMEDAKELTKSIELANKAGKDQYAIIDAYGKKANEIAQEAALRGELDKIPKSVQAIGAAFQREALAKELKDIDEKAQDAAKTFNDKLKEAAQAAAAAIKGLNQSMTDALLTGNEKRIAEVYKQRDAEIAAVNETKRGLDESLKAQTEAKQNQAAADIAVLEANKTAGQAVSQEQIAAINARTAEEIAALGVRTAAQKGQLDDQIGMLRLNAEQQRDIMMGTTTDYEFNAMTLGVITDKANQQALEKEKLKLAAMQDSRSNATAQEIAEQERKIADMIDLDEKEAKQRGLITLERMERERDIEADNLQFMMDNKEMFYDWEIERQREQVERMTKGVQQEAKKRGLATKAEMVERRKTAESDLAFMLANEKDFTKEQIAQGKQRVRAAKEDAGEIGVLWRKAVGGISGALNSTADSFARLATIGNESMGKVAQGMSLAATMAGDVKSLMEPPQDPMSMIIKGAKLAVDAIMGMWDAFTKSPGEDVMGRVGERLGVAIGEELGNTIAKTAKEKFKGDRFAAELFHMSDIIEAAGGISETNFDKLLGGLRDTFSLLEKKTVTVDQAREILDKNFGAFADHVVKSGKIASAAFVEMIQLNQKFGTQSKEIADFVAGQVEKLGTAFEKMVSPLAKAAEPFEDLKKETAELTKLSEDRNKAIAAATEKALKGGKQEQKALEELQKTGGAAYDAQKKKVDELLVKQKQVATESMPAIERAGRLMMSSFNGSIKSGVSMLDAVEKLGPGLDSILKTMGNLGIDVEKSSVAYIVQFRNRVNANKELVESTSSLNEIMLGMSNIGALDADSFKDLQAQGLESYAKLEAAGFKQNERLTMMKGFLESARDAHANMGLPIDENTAKLIEEAEATGVLSEKQLDSNKIMMEGLGAIITAVGGTLPAAWATAAKAGVDAAKTISDGVDDTVNATLEEQEKQLQKDAWAENARDAERASLKIRTSIGKVDGKLDLVDQALEHNEWDGWADDAIDAASRVEGAVNGVSLGHSPGGLKEIPLKLRAANDAFKVWERIGVGAATEVQSAVDAMRGRDLGISGLRTAGISTQMPSGDFVRQVSGADAERTDAPVNLTFNITSMDPAGVELVTERKILPAMVKILRRGRNLADMQTVLNLKG